MIAVHVMTWCNGDMDGMTMVFRAQEPPVLKQVKPRDRVKFETDEDQPFRPTRRRGDVVMEASAGPLPARSGML